MPGERLSMRKIREVLRLRLGQGLPQRAVAQSLRLSQGAVHGYVERARRSRRRADHPRIPATRPRLQCTL
jgi:DNA-directed RNA polymerase specialized sigma24 family protein